MLNKYFSMAPSFVGLLCSFMYCMLVPRAGTSCSWGWDLSWSRKFLLVWLVANSCTRHHFWPQLLMTWLTWWSGQCSKPLCCSPGFDVIGHRKITTRPASCFLFCYAQGFTMYRECHVAHAERQGYVWMGGSIVQKQLIFLHCFFWWVYLF